MKTTSALTVFFLISNYLLFKLFHDMEITISAFGPYPKMHMISEIWNYMLFSIR